MALLRFDNSIDAFPREWTCRVMMGAGGTSSNILDVHSQKLENHWYSGQSSGTASQKPGFCFQLCHWLSLWPRALLLISPCLRFPFPTLYICGICLAHKFFGARTRSLGIYRTGTIGLRISVEVYGRLRSKKASLLWGRFLLTMSNTLLRE